MKVQFDVISVWNFLLALCAVVGGAVFVLGAYRKATIEMLRQNSDALKDAVKQKTDEILELKDRLVRLEKEVTELKTSQDRVTELNLELQMDNERLRKDILRLKEENRRLMVTTATVLVDGPKEDGGIIK